MRLQPRNALLSANGWSFSGIVLACAMLIAANSRPALGVVINAGSTTVNSIGHSFQPPNGSHPGVVTDFLIDQAQNVGGGAALPGVALNMDTGTAVSYAIQAPVGRHFQVSLPTGTLSTEFSGSMQWTAAPPPLGEGIGLGGGQTFTNLTGIAPVFPAFGGGTASDGYNGWFELAFDSTSVHTFGFSSMTTQTDYEARSFGTGVLSYSPTADANVFFSYTTNSTTDPGPFVAIVPEPSSLALFVIAGLGLIACLRRQPRLRPTA